MEERTRLIVYITVLTMFLIFLISLFTKTEHFTGMIVSDDAGNFTKLAKNVAVSIDTPSGPKEVMKILDDGTVQIGGNLAVSGAVTVAGGVTSNGDISGKRQLVIDGSATIGPAYIGMGENPNWAQFSHKAKTADGKNEGYCVLTGNVTTRAHARDGFHISNGPRMEDIFGVGGDGSFKSLGPGIISNAYVGKATEAIKGGTSADDWAQFRHVSCKNGGYNAHSSCQTDTWKAW